MQRSFIYDSQFVMKINAQRAYQQEAAFFSLARLELLLLIGQTVCMPSLSEVHL